MTAFIKDLDGDAVAVSTSSSGQVVILEVADLNMAVLSPAMCEELAAALLAHAKEVSA